MPVPPLPTDGSSTASSPEEVAPDTSAAAAAPLTVTAPVVRAGSDAPPPPLPPASLSGSTTTWTLSVRVLLLPPEPRRGSADSPFYSDALAAGPDLDRRRQAGAPPVQHRPHPASIAAASLATSPFDRQRPTSWLAPGERQRRRGRRPLGTSVVARPVAVAVPLEPDKDVRPAKVDQRRALAPRGRPLARAFGREQAPCGLGPVRVVGRRLGWVRFVGRPARVGGRTGRRRWLVCASRARAGRPAQAAEDGRQARR